MAGELVRTTAEVPDVVTAVRVYGDIVTQIVNTDFVPKAYRGKPEATLACMLYGREIGLGPLQSVQLIDNIQGTPTLNAEGMRLQVGRAGHRIWPEEYTDSRVTLAGWRRGDPAEVVARVTWTLEDAKRAGLLGKETWKQYPRAMLTARATSELCRLHFADVIGGLSYVPEEAESFGPAPVSAPMSAEQQVPQPTVTTVNGDTGEIRQIESTTRREPPKPKPGYVAAAEAKQRLVKAFTDQGISDETAKASAKELWGPRGRDAVTEEHLAQMLAQVAQPELPDENTDDGLGLPFDDTQEPV